MKHVEDIAHKKKELLLTDRHNIFEWATEIKIYNKHNDSQYKEEKNDYENDIPVPKN